MIELDEFELPAKDYFRIIFWTQTVSMFWVWAYLTVFLYAGAIVFGNWLFFGINSVLLAMFFLLTAYFTGRYYAYSKDNKIFFQKLKMTFGNGTYHIVSEDGSEGHGPLSHFCKADTFNGYYLLYLSNLTCYHIPVSAFRSEEDRTRFETEILGDKLKTKTTLERKILVFLIISVCLLALASASRSPVCC